MKIHLRGSSCQMGRSLGRFRPETDRIEDVTCRNCAGLRRQKDVTGQSFGNLTALAPVGLPDKRGDRVWRFACVCGAEVERNISNVRRSVLDGSSPSCGCTVGKRKNPQAIPPAEFLGNSKALENQAVKFLDENVFEKPKAKSRSEILFDPEIPMVRATPARVASVRCPKCRGRHVHAWTSGLRVPPCTRDAADAYTIICDDDPASRARPPAPTPQSEAAWLSMLGENVRELRSAIGLNQRELAWRAGVERTYVGDIERGARSNVGFATIVKLAGALGTTPAVLFTPATRTSIATMRDLTVTDEDQRALADLDEALF